MDDLTPEQIEAIKAYHAEAEAKLETIQSYINATLTLIQQAKAAGHTDIPQEAEMWEIIAKADWAEDELIGRLREIVKQLGSKI